MSHWFSLNIILYFCHFFLLHGLSQSLSLSIQIILLGYTLKQKMFANSYVYFKYMNVMAVHSVIIRMGLWWDLTTPG